MDNSPAVEGPRLKPIPITSSMNAAADAMERMIGALNVAENICMRLIGTCPKPTPDGHLDRNSIMPAEGSDMCLADVAAGQRETFKAIAVRFEMVMNAIDEAI